VPILRNAYLDELPRALTRQAGGEFWFLYLMVQADAEWARRHSNGVIPPKALRRRR
jgi:hypothetical protein